MFVACNKHFLACSGCPSWYRCPAIIFSRILRALKLTFFILFGASKVNCFCSFTASDGVLCSSTRASIFILLEGISIFTVSALRTPESRAMFKAYADSVRAVRAENNGVNPALSKSTKVTNPFESMDILNRINAKIKELANVPIPNIADYKLVNEKGATKYYEVKELNTGKTFCVDFYFYGGILSGWNVTVK